MTWWMWIAAGCVLLLVELLTPGAFFWLFFGVGALVAGLAGFLMPDLALGWQGAIFLAVSLVSLMLFREPLLARLNRGMKDTKGMDNLVGETAMTLEAIAPQAFGKAELRGTSWTAMNTGERPLIASERVRVERVDGLTLCVRGE